VNRRGTQLVTALVGLRLAAIPLFLYAYLRGSTQWSLAVFAGAVLTDALDGCVARRWDTTPLSGHFSDAGADFLLILAAFSAFILKGVYPVWTLLPIAGMFIQFLATSRPDRPIYDPVGKYYGIALFATIGVTLAWPCLLVYRSVPRAILVCTAATLASRYWFFRNRHTR
jgi:CDP-diacylglycerol--glycerol-3-phosphate 3-phosphatidyltransferase